MEEREGGGEGGEEGEIKSEISYENESSLSRLIVLNYLLVSSSLPKVNAPFE